MYEKPDIPRPGIRAGQTMPPPPVPEGSVAHSVESLEKQISATGEVLLELGRRLERVLVPDESANKQASGCDTPTDNRRCVLTNQILTLDHRLASVRHGVEELIRRINL